MHGLIPQLAGMPQAEKARDRARGRDGPASLRRKEPRPFAPQDLPVGQCGQLHPLMVPVDDPGQPRGKQIVLPLALSVSPSSPTTFCRWHDRFVGPGADGPGVRSFFASVVWNQIPQAVRDQALNPALSFWKTAFPMANLRPPSLPSSVTAPTAASMGAPAS